MPKVSYTARTIGTALPAMIGATVHLRTPLCNSLPGLVFTSR